MACARGLGPLLLLCVLGCQNEAVGVRLVFPSERTFLLAETVSLSVYDGEGNGEASPDAICRSLSVVSSVAPAGLQPLATSLNQPACTFLDGGVTFDAIETGRRVFFAEASSAAGVPALRGCAVADLFADDSDDPEAEDLGVASFVEVQLATLPSFPEEQTPACADVDAKCQENQRCAP
ncbi:MAG: hypothetical protein IT383_12385 [Deltaproteobacteria bacterium]|nr:hypothetical protein [Deltaproteobacteria bacterium]